MMDDGIQHMFVGYDSTEDPVTPLPPDSGGPSRTTNQSSRNIISQLPSHQPDVCLLAGGRSLHDKNVSPGTLQRNRSTLRRRTTRHKPFDEADFASETEREAWERLQEVKNLTTSLDMKRKYS